MITVRMYVPVVILLSISILSAQRMATLPTDPGGIKIEEGRFCWWRVNTSDPASPQVKIFERDGSLLAALNILETVPEAKSVSIYDVAVRGNSLIAVAAMYSKDQGSQPAGALLYFDFSAKLLSFVALHPSRSILKLAIDESLNVWTLTTSSGGKEPSEVPMLVQYDARGRVVGNFLTRAMFPMHAEDVQESPATGFAAFGYQTGTLWFWLPGSTELVTFKARTGETSRASTGLPGSGETAPRSLYRQPSGALVAEVVQPRQGEPRFIMTRYLWSPDGRQWTPSAPAACPQGALVGVSDNELFLANVSERSTEICAAPVSSQ